MNDTTTPFAATALHARFLALLPRIEQAARFRFASLRCPGRRDDAIAEVTALCWAWFLRLVCQGKDPATFASMLASFACRHVRSGRKLCGQEKVKDVLSVPGQAQNRFSVASLPAYSSLHGNVIDNALRDNTHSPPDEQAAFRIDFPVWLGSLGERRRQIAEDLLAGERTQHVAARRGLSPARISQVRSELATDWRRFHGENLTV